MAAVQISLDESEINVVVSNDFSRRAVRDVTFGVRDQIKVKF